MVARTLGSTPFGYRQSAPLPCEPRQRLQRGLVLRDGLVRVAVPKLVHREGDGLRDLQAGGDGVRPVGEEAAHLLGRLQVPLGVGLQQVARAVDPGAVADAGHHVLKGAALGHVVAHVARGEDRAAVGLRHRVETVHARAVVAAMAHRRRHVAHSGQGGGEAGQAGLEQVQVLVRHRDQVQALRVIDQHLQREVRLRLGLPLARRVLPLASRQERREAGIGGAVPRVGEKLGAAGELQARADQGIDAGRRGVGIHPHDAGERVAVGDADPAVAEPIRLRREVAGGGGALEEREAARDAELHEGHVLMPDEGLVLCQDDAGGPVIQGHGGRFAKEGRLPPVLGACRRLARLGRASPSASARLRRGWACASHQGRRAVLYGTLQAGRGADRSCEEPVDEPARRQLHGPRIRGSAARGALEGDDAVLRIPLRRREPARSRPARRRGQGRRGRSAFRRGAGGSAPEGQDGSGVRRAGGILGIGMRRDRGIVLPGRAFDLRLRARHVKSRTVVVKTSRASAPPGWPVP